MRHPSKLMKRVLRMNRAKRALMAYYAGHARHMEMLKAGTIQIFRERPAANG
jgi:hypothetical protein